jgi:methyl-accepting chemotaxis protein
MTEKIAGVNEQNVINAGSVVQDSASLGSVINQLHSLAEFNLDAEFIRVNENYQQLMGYAAEDMLGNKLTMLLDLKSQHSEEYQLLWQKLRSGESVCARFKRIAKGAKIVWINASYVPVIGVDGSVLSVVESATDVTAHVLLSEELAETLQQVKSVLLMVKSGDLSQQIAVVAKNADLAELCNEVNALLASTRAIVELVKRAGYFIVEAAAKVEAVSKALIKNQRH